MKNNCDPVIEDKVTGSQTLFKTEKALAQLMNQILVKGLQINALDL